MPRGSSDAKTGILELPDPLKTCAERCQFMNVLCLGLTFTLYYAVKYTQGYY
jgi:hypothetical protein